MNMPQMHRVAPEDSPAFHILETKMQAILDAITAQSAQQRATVEGRLLNEYLREGGTAVNGVSSYDFAAQTHDTEIITFLLAYIPSDVSNAYLVVDDLQIPLPPGEFTATSCRLLVRSPNRSLQWTGTAATTKPFILLNALAAPSNIPGIIH